MRRTAEFAVDVAAQLPLHLKSLRKLRGLTQAEMAKRLRVGQSRYAMIEKNPGSVAFEQIFAILAILQADLMIRLRDLHKKSYTPKPGEDW